MKLRRYLLATLVLFMFSLATGCGNSPTNSTEDAAISTVNATAATTSVQEQSTNMNPQSTSIQEQSNTTPPSPLKLLKTIDAVGKVNIAGFLNEKYGITAGYAGEVHFTEDGGTSWPAGTNQSLCRFGLDIADEKTAWNCGNGGNIRKTSDGGKTWSALTDFGDSEPGHCRFISFSDDMNGWIAAPRKLGSTTDGGKSWVEITLPDGIDKIVAMSQLTAQNGYLLDFSGVLYVTQDGAKTWTTKKVPLNGKFLLGTKAPVAAMHFTDTNNALIAADITNDKGTQLWVLKTVDGGDNWEQTLVPDIKMASLYLSRDAKYLTIYDMLNKKTFLFSYQPVNG